MSSKLLEKLWTNSYPVAFVDGFANNAYKHPQRNQFMPQFLTGDFDSIEPHVLNFYKSNVNKVQVIETPDQHQTDFNKCLNILIEFINQDKVNVDVIVAANASGGRFDHQMASIKTLYEVRKTCKIPILLVDEICVSFLLDQGEHTLNMNTGLENNHVGIIPIGDASIVSTTGLEWNLDNHLLSFDTIISTSNHLIHKQLTIKCSKPVVFTMDYKIYDHH